VSPSLALQACENLRFIDELTPVPRPLLVPLARRSAWQSRGRKASPGRTFEPASLGRANSALELASSVTWRSVGQTAAEALDLGPLTFESGSESVARWPASRPSLTQSPASRPAVTRSPIARPPRKPLDLLSRSRRYRPQNVALRPWAAVARVQPPQFRQDLIQFSLDSRQPRLQFLRSDTRTIRTPFSRRVLAVATFARPIASLPVTCFAIAAFPIAPFTFTTLPITTLPITALARRGVIGFAPVRLLRHRIASAPPS
jgi:hypothetical protein